MDRGNIVLIGFMGSGKSTVARNLSKRYGMQMIDMDQEIEEREGRNIPQIFEESGESYFRDLETNLLIELQECQNLIISCGGGIVVRESNIPEMKKAGTVVLLSATAKTIYYRVRYGKNRPLLNGNMNPQYIQELMNKRCDKYEAAADVVVATDGNNAKNICDEVYKAVYGAQ